MHEKASSANLAKQHYLKWNDSKQHYAACVNAVTKVKAVLLLPRYSTNFLHTCSDYATLPRSVVPTTV